ncbi:centrosomal protein of 70 kDa isoform X1 [Gambusia affinis]|uniref:centrosomal protein of 70 kDa isoform X1 n=2 Tax=Gambusia affinis TaxID=33528 RepID=UPI001CDD639E|nr:centrosomal protein of 70 kDa isoform X1 [Gambusia affinis]XP_043965246.1 centrosomal protein of 70 kDa isoform X1 [Gambusia affinis]
MMKPQEQVEWDDVNKLLQHHGFKPVFFADPVENRNLTDLVLLDKKSASELRMTLRMMLMDSERRQTLIQELVKSNNQLREEVQKHMSHAAQQSQRATELQGLLDEVKSKVQHLEERCLGKAVQQHSHTQQLQKENKEAKTRYLLLEKKVANLEEETAQLRKKLYLTVKEEEQRLTRPSRLQESKQLDQATKRTSASVSPSFKTILKTYQDQQKESNSRIQELEEEVERLKTELDTRCRSDLTGNSRDQSKTSRQRVQYHHLLTEINTLIINPRLHQYQRWPRESEEAEFQAVLPTLEQWSQQLHLLRDLHSRLNKLSATLMPLQPCDADAKALKVEDMIGLVEALLENASSDDKQKLRSPTRYTLASMVGHFQKLFDVPSLSGVYPRMNEVYTRLGEMTNTIRNLQNVLDLDSKASPTEVVNQVSRLVFLDPGLGRADIDSIIIKVKQHDEFFPAFHNLVTEILKILGVSHLDDILPALQSLKQTAQ